MIDSRYGFRHVIRMEWIKLRSLRSVWLALTVTVIGAVAIAVGVGLNSTNAAEDVTNNVLAGISAGLLLTGVLGVLMIAGEYSSGAIRSTLAAGELATFIALLAGVAALPSNIPAPSLSDPGVLRAVMLAGTGYPLVGLIGLGLGTIIRHAGAAIAALVGAVYVGAQFLGAVAHAAIPYVPIAIVGDSLAVSRPHPHAGVAPLPPWGGFGVLSLYAAAALGLGAWLMVRRDA